MAHALPQSAAVQQMRCHASSHCAQRHAQSCQACAALTHLAADACLRMQPALLAPHPVLYSYYVRPQPQCHILCLYVMLCHVTTLPCLVQPAKSSHGLCRPLLARFCWLPCVLHRHIVHRLRLRKAVRPCQAQCPRQTCLGSVRYLHQSLATVTCTPSHRC